MAAFVSGEETSCEMVAAGADTWVRVRAGVIGVLPAGVGNNRARDVPGQQRAERMRQLTKRQQVASTVRGAKGAGVILRIPAIPNAVQLRPGLSANERIASIQIA